MIATSMNYSNELQELLDEDITNFEARIREDKQGHADAGLLISRSTWKPMSLVSRGVWKREAYITERCIVVEELK